DDVMSPRAIVIIDYFYPRPPRGGRLGTHSNAGADEEIISIHVPRVGDDARPWSSLLVVEISIHVPRVGHDEPDTVIDHRLRNFYPRPPRGGRHPAYHFRFFVANRQNFYPRPPRGGRHSHQTDY